MRMMAHDGLKLSTRSLRNWLVRGATWGMLSLGLGASTGFGQTELFRFRDTPGVVVFRPADPVQVVAPPAPTTTWRVPVASPVIELPTSPVTTTVFSPAEPSTFWPAEPSTFSSAEPWATEWTAVSEPRTVTALSPVVPSVPPTTTFAEPTTTFFAPTAVVPVDPTVVAPGTVTVFRPVVTYQPVVIPATQVVVPVQVPVTVGQNVFVEGQPLRNLWRAITQ